MVTPISDSSSRMAVVRLGWEINSFSAAALMVPHSATVTAYFSCCRVIKNTLLFLSVSDYF